MGVRETLEGAPSLGRPRESGKVWVGDKDHPNASSPPWPGASGIDKVLGDRLWVNPREHLQRKQQPPGHRGRLRPESPQRRPAGASKKENTGPPSGTCESFRMKTERETERRPSQGGTGLVPTVSPEPGPEPGLLGGVPAPTAASPDPEHSCPLPSLRLLSGEGPPQNRSWTQPRG